MKVAYLIVDRYEHHEFYDIYGKGIYNSFEEAKADWKKELYDFLAYGPDDCHSFMLVQLELTDEEYTKLEQLVTDYKDGTVDREAEDFTKNMEALVYRPESKQIYSEDDSANVEICEMAEADGYSNNDLTDNPDTYSTYFEKYYNKYYK